MINERKLTPVELKKREDIIMNMKGNKRDLVKKYGKDAEAVMYGRATNMAKKQTENMRDSKLTELIKDALKNPKAADLDKDGKLSSYEKTRGAAIEKNVSEDYDGQDLESGAYGDPVDAELDVTTAAPDHTGEEAELGLEEDFGDKAKTNWRDPDWYKDTFAWANKEQLKVVDDLIKKARKQKGAMEKVAQMALSKNFKDYIQKQVEKLGLEENYIGDEKLSDLKNMGTADMNLWHVVKLIDAGILDDSDKNRALKSFDPSRPLEEDIDLGHEDNEPGMLQGDLYQIGKSAMEIYELLDAMEGQGEVDLPSWWQSKIFKAKEAIVGASEYLEFELKEPAIDGSRYSCTFRY